MMDNFKKNIIYPIAKKHAIEVMAIGVDFRQPLSDEKLKEFVNVYENSSFLKKMFPHKSEVNAMVVQVNNENISSGHEIEGYDLHSVDDAGGLSWIVSLRPHFIACNCKSYDRWDSVKSISLDILEPFLDYLYFCEIDLLAIGLQYLDVFDIDNVSFPQLNEELFSKSSSFLPPNVFARKGAWHTHNGWFSESEKKRKVLNRFNIDMLDKGLPDKFMARINGQHKVYAVLLDGTSESPIIRNEIPQILNMLHRYNKDSLVDILSPKVLDLIGLKDL